MPPDSRIPPRRHRDSAASPGHKQELSAKFSLLHRHRTLLLAILVTSLALRIWGLSDRLPDPAFGPDPIRDTLVDETDRREVAYAWEMWRGGTRDFDLNPHAGEWPGLSFYVTLGSQVAYRGIHSLASGNWSATEFASHVRTDPRGIFLSGRIAGVLIGLATIYLTYLLGLYTLGPVVGLLGALLIGTNATHILISQHVTDPNLLALLFVLAAGVVISRTRSGEGDPDVRASALAGAMIGLAGACKYVPVVLVVPLAASLIVRHDESGRYRLRVPWQALLAGVGGALVAFAVASPYTFLDWRTAWGDIVVQRERHLSEWVGQTHGAIALPEYLIKILPSMLGWPAYVMALVGTYLVLRRSGRSHIIWIPGTLLIANGFLSVAQPRFILPALPFLFVLAACVVARIADPAFSRLRSPAQRWVLASVLIALAMAMPLRTLVEARNAFSLPDSRHAAQEWIKRSIDPVVPIAVDVYGPPVHTQGDTRPAVTWPFFAEEAQLVEVAYHPEWLDGVGYCALSGGVAGRFESNRSAHANERNYFAWLRRNAPIVWNSDDRTMSGAAIEIRKLPQAISTAGQRDSLWAATTVDPRAAGTLGSWCRFMAEAFLAAGSPERAREWATRGLTITRSSSRRPLIHLLAFLDLKEERVQELLSMTRSGLGEFPDDDLLHLYRGMALEASGDAKAAGEYRESLRLNPGQPQAEKIRARMERIETGSLGR